MIPKILTRAVSMLVLDGALAIGMYSGPETKIRFTNFSGTTFQAPANLLSELESLYVEMDKINSRVKREYFTNETINCLNRIGIGFYYGTGTPGVYNERKREIGLNPKFVNPINRGHFRPSIEGILIHENTHALDISCKAIDRKRFMRLYNNLNENHPLKITIKERMSRGKYKNLSGERYLREIIGLTAEYFVMKSEMVPEELSETLMLKE